MTRSENMARVKAKDTSVEILLRREFWKRGYRYRKNDKTVFGKPDIVFKSKKIAIFCDSEFWHGKDYIEGKLPKTNTEFWKRKLQKNIERDAEVNRTLENNGWLVIRIWAKEIKKNVACCVDKLEETLKGKLVNELHNYTP